MDECKEAGRQLLEAVGWLHRNNFVHRDIRESNVMRSGGQWFLIDLEWANHAGLGRGEYDPALRPPECDGPDFVWNASADMWQFRKLLQSWKLLDQDGRNLVRVLTTENPADRLSVEQTMGHPFFVQVE